MAPSAFTARPRLAAALLTIAVAGDASEAALAPEYAAALERDDACVQGGPSCSLALSQLRASARGGHSSSLARLISPHVLESADTDLALLASGECPTCEWTRVAANTAFHESLELAIPGPEKVAPAVLDSVLPWAAAAAHEAEQEVAEVEAQSQLELQPQPLAQAEPHVQPDDVPTDTVLAAAAAPPSVQQNVPPAMPQAMQEEDHDDSGRKEERRRLNSDMFTKIELTARFGENASDMLWVALTPENLHALLSDAETKKEIIAAAGEDGGKVLMGYFSNWPDSETSDKAPGDGYKATLAHVHHSGTGHSQVRSHSKAPQSNGKAHKTEGGTKRHAHIHVPDETAAHTSTEGSYTTTVGGLEVVVMGEPGNTKH